MSGSMWFTHEYGADFFHINFPSMTNENPNDMRSTVIYDIDFSNAPKDIKMIVYKDFAAKVNYKQKTDMLNRLRNRRFYI